MANRHYRNNWNFILNLASEPRRNRRIYLLLVSVLIILILVITSILLIFNLKSLAEFRELKKSNQVLKEKKSGLSAESLQLSREVGNFSRVYQEQVDEINKILERKAFSWVKFFSRLEEALPARSFLTAFTPQLSSSTLEFRVKIALNSREELGGLIKNLMLQKFGEIRVLNENFQDNKFEVEMIFRDAEAK